MIGKVSSEGLFAAALSRFASFTARRCGQVLQLQRRRDLDWRQDLESQMIPPSVSHSGIDGRAGSEGIGVSLIGGAAIPLGASGQHPVVSPPGAVDRPIPY